MSLIENYPVSRVPIGERLSFLSVTLVHAGMLTALDQFMLGAVLGHSMTLTDAFLAIFIASVIFGIVTFAVGYAGMKEGLSSSLLSRWCGFGRVGSLFVSLVIAVSLLGWFGVQNAVFAKGLNYALNDRFGFAWSATFSGLFLTILVAFGFKALRFTARIAVPLFIAVIVTVSILILSGHKSSELVSAIPAGVSMSVPAGITMIIGGCIVASLITPDMSRYSKSGRHVFWMTIVSIIIGEFIINGLAILLARAVKSADVVSIMAETAGGIGLLVVVFSTLRVNDINLYSSSLGIANSIFAITGRKVNFTAIILTVGCIGTGLSVAGILDRFIDFLTLLGVVFPPLLGVMIVDYYFLKSSRALLKASRLQGKLPEDEHIPTIGWTAIVCCVIGGAVGFTTSWGIPALNSLLAASLLYWVIGIFFKK
ncbi:cytosine permease [Serratia sp. M24T3]|uniref:Cytosine permease n=1 Tax=Rouxiella sp. WC2420 TaxID=3234145 RepID=A0AB39VR53_9GAMM|nr:cytosine permease [Serratia sp. M24T3]EIC86663.1 permease for cytosine/purines uracil thiamine allantoin [Serratia sp. M24T3]